MPPLLPQALADGQWSASDVGGAHLASNQQNVLSVVSARSLLYFFIGPIHENLRNPPMYWCVKR